MNSDGITVESAKDLVLKATNNVSIKGVKIEAEATSEFSAKGNTKAALQSVVLAKALLQDRQALWRRKTLDGRHLMVIELRSEQQTGAGGLTIEKDRAGAANAVFAPDVGAGELQVLAKEIGQRQPWFDLCLDGLAIDLQGDRDRADHVLTTPLESEPVSRLG